MPFRQSLRAFPPTPMFEKWYHAFEDAGSGNVQMKTSVAVGDNGLPVGKDLHSLLNQVITNDNKLRIVVSA